MNKNYNDFNISVSNMEYAIEKIAYKDWEYSCASRPFYGLICVLSGSAECSCNNTATIIGKGTIISPDFTKCHLLTI